MHDIANAPMSGVVILLGPAVIVSCIGLAMLRKQTRGAADATRQNRRFLICVAGGGCVVLLLMIIALVIFDLLTRGGQVPAWFLFAPWGFAIGEIVGLVLWKRRTTRAAA
jgi:cytochrome bd-type quinol oxidase subunit 2